MSILYFDCTAGISGDMTVAALLDLGVPFEHLREQLTLLPLDPSEYSLSTRSVSRKGVTATQFRVDVIREQHHHRHYGDIVRMIGSGGLNLRAQELAQRIFRRLAEAEARVHGVEIERVHFHEVGAVDSIIDIVGAAICLDYLRTERIHCSQLPFGSGFVETAHGLLPVPAPATAELLQGMAVHHRCGPGERVTPTGAAVLAALAESSGPAPAMRINASGRGAGSRDFDDLPNVLRVFQGDQDEQWAGDAVHVLETNIDDMNPEVFGFLMDRLLEQGALDVAYTPIQMKKNRPGVRLSLLSSPDRLRELAATVLQETTAAGVRHYPVDRIMLRRCQEERQTSLGPVRVKLFSQGDRLVRVAPEYEECRRIAEERNLPLLEVYRIVQKEACTP